MTYYNFSLSHLGRILLAAFGLGLISLGAYPLKASRILVLYALDQDLAALTRELGPPIRTDRLGERTHQVFRLHGHTIDALRMGSGVVQTAVGVSAYLTRHRPDYCFSIGVAGSLNDELAIGEWVRVESFVPWQSGAVEDRSGLPPSTMFSMPTIASVPAGSSWEAMQSVTTASGEGFIASDAFRRLLADHTNAHIVEMNIAGMVAGLGKNPPPGLHVRVISDHANERAREDFADFRRRYDGTGGAHLAELLRALPPDPTSPGQYENLGNLFPQGASSN